MHYSKETHSCSIFRVITIDFRVSEILGFLQYLLDRFISYCSSRLNVETIVSIDLFQYERNVRLF